jgi:aminoglycoside 2'-N-acetyltransferase I
VSLGYRRYVRLEAITSDQLTDDRRVKLRALFDAAYAEAGSWLTDDDWQHMLGGVHFLLLEGDDVAAHTAVVERELETGGHAIRTGYVEAVATWPHLQGRGYGSQLMHAAHAHIDARYELGALNAAAPAFYEARGWIRWEGPTAVRTPDGIVPTPEEDGSVYVRLTPASPAIDLSGRITCDWRPGDVW